MTVTASALDRDLVGRVVGPRYSSRARAVVTYTVTTTPHFRLIAELTGDTWTVSDRHTGIYGAGDTPSEALQDFRRAVTEHLDVLERQDVLSDDLAAQLRYLRARV